jgi:predicted alpha-1,2-mannosidase
MRLPDGRSAWGTVATIAAALLAGVALLPAGSAAAATTATTATTASAASAASTATTGRLTTAAAATRLTTTAHLTTTTTTATAATRLTTTARLTTAATTGRLTRADTSATSSQNAAGGHGAGPRQVTNPASLVNPFIGTSNGANDFPGADAPFGMVQWSPDTTSRPDGGGYSYGDSAITGFSLTHLSGPGCGAEGDIPILPTTGAVNTGATDSFSHSSESADAGNYQVTTGNGVTTDLTATTRTGMAQFTFPSTTAANLIFKLDSSQNPDSATSFNVVSDTEVQGSVTSGDFCSAGNTYTAYFDMRFSRPFSTTGTFGPKGLRRGARHLSLKAAKTGSRAAIVSPHATERPGHPVYHGPRPAGRAAATPDLTGPDGAYLTFNTTSNQTLLAKVGLSYVSTANAAANLTAENSGWNFASTLSATQGAWNTLLGKVQVSGGTSADQADFYTALYHSLLHPNVFSDDNGQYMGVDGKVHTVDSGHQAFYTNFSGWDIYRTQAQLEALVDPQAASDTAESMVDDYAQGGMLPKWMEDNGETYVMVGDPADSIIADYYAFGARSFNTSAALSDMVAEATKSNNIRPGLNYTNEPGYLPADGSYGCCNYYGPTATTLEYGTADFAVSALAGDLGDSSDQQTFLNRSQNWWNVINPDSGMAQPRDANATWVSGFDPTSDSNFVEADSWIYTGMVPYDLAGLAAAKGGNTAMAAYLGTVLRNFTGANGYAWMGNEPSIELPWEYDYIGQPYQTQETVRQIQDQLWSDSPSGLGDGNDDLGAMSAWFVWSALGLYPMTPGESALALGSPMFTQASIALPSGKTLTIDGNGAADNAPYVQSATWNGSAWNNAYAPTSAITSGGTLSYTLGTSANTSWASAASAAPPSYTGSTVAPPQPRVGPVTSGVSSSLCIDDNQSSTTPGNPVQIWGCDSTDAQSWTIAPNGTVSALGLCLDAWQSGTTNGTLIDLYTCNGSGAQQWETATDGGLENPESGLCLDDPNASTTNGTQLQLYTCNQTPAQDWTLPKAPPSRVGAITSGVSSSLCVNDSGGSTANGNPVQVATCDSSTAQTWTIEPDGTLHVLGKCMDVINSGTTSGTLIDLYQCNGTGAQQWRIKTNGALENPESGLCLDDPGSSTTPGTQLQLYTCNQTPAQDWTLPS